MEQITNKDMKAALSGEKWEKWTPSSPGDQILSP
jgi:hypothetical protein